MEWLSNLNQWLDGLTPWFALSAGLLGVLAWAVGLKSVLGILEKVIDVVAPILKLAVETAVGTVKWLWDTIYKFGLGDIIDNWRTVVTVATLVLGTGYYSNLRMEAKVDSVVEELTFCQSETGRLERELKKMGKSHTEPNWFDQFRLW